MWGAIGRGFAKVFTFFIKHPQALEGVVTVVEAVRKKPAQAVPVPRPVDPPPADPMKYYCADRHPTGPICTLPTGHVGPHAAHAPNGAILFHWG